MQGSKENCGWFAVNVHENVSGESLFIEKYRNVTAWHRELAQRNVRNIRKLIENTTWINTAKNGID